MNIRHRFVSLFLLTASLFFIQLSLTSAAIITCPGSPANNTLSWNTGNPGSCSSQSGGSANAACNFTAYAGGSKSIPLGTSCSASLSCPEASPSTVSDSIIYDASKVWNGSSCVTPAPTVSFTASSPVAYGARSTLTWSSSGATSCTASGPWSTGGSTSSTGLSSSLTSNTTFGIQCTGPGGTSPLQTVTVTVAAPASCTLPWGGSIADGQSATAYQTASVTSPATCTNETRTCSNGTLSGSYTNQSCSVNTPVISFTASSPISYGSRSTLTWNATGATSCTASGPWSNSGTLSGSGLTNPLTSNTTFGFQCTGPGGTSPLQTVTVSVNSPAACNLPWGGTVADSQSAIAYQSSTVTTPADCTSISQTRSCSNGALSGSYTNQNCTVLIPGCMLSAANNYNPLANVSDGSCCYGWDSWNGSVCVTPSPQASLLLVEPRTATLGSQSTLSWDIKYPDNSCALSAKTVCASGTCAPGSPEITAQNNLNTAIDNNSLKSPANTDSNDPYGPSRPMTNALQTVSPTSTTNARGKKTLRIRYTTDFTLKCGASFTTSFKKVRFLVTFNHEG